MRYVITTLVALSMVPQLAAQERWTTVRSWEGQGIQETESFEITDREWRIAWRSEGGPMPSAGILQIFVYRLGEDFPRTLAANHTGPGSAVSYVRGSPGRWHLTINSANINWRVEVQVRGGG